MNTKKYAPKLPIDIDDDGNFIKISDGLENAKQNLKMVILTNPGEKLMDPEFGVGVRKYLFENVNGIVKYDTKNNSLQTVQIQSLQQNLANSIEAQCIKYCNDISIDAVQVIVQEQVLNLRIEYTYKEAVSGDLELTIGL